MCLRVSWFVSLGIPWIVPETMRGWKQDLGRGVGCLTGGLPPHLHQANWQSAKCQTHPPNERRSLGTWSQATPSINSWLHRSQQLGVTSLLCRFSGSVSLARGAGRIKEGKIGIYFVSSVLSSWPEHKMTLKTEAREQESVSKTGIKFH